MPTVGNNSVTESSRPVRVLVVGAGTPNADFVAKVLSQNGYVADWTDQLKRPSLSKLWRHDIIYGIYLQSCSRNIILGKLLGKRTIVHFVGSDAYWYSRERSNLRRLYWRVVLGFTDLVLYVSSHLTELVGRKGVILPFPIETQRFKSAAILAPGAERDVLYYCPSGDSNERIYRLDWIIDYARNHPEQSITILGNKSHPAHYEVNLPNVQVISSTRQDDMPLLYRKHKRLIRMSTEDGLPRMVHEALLAGIAVVYNGQPVSQVPAEREPAQFAKSFSAALATVRE